jgi:hypothetical protein
MSQKEIGVPRERNQAKKFTPRVARSLLTQKRQLFSLNMAQARHRFLDASPPPYTSSRNTLDNESFRKTLSVLAARVTGVLLKAAELRK